MHCRKLTALRAQAQNTSQSCQALHLALQLTALCIWHCKSTINRTMYKAVLALAASAGAFAPSVHQRATVVQQGVPLANGAMEFDRMQPASA